MNLPNDFRTIINELLTNDEAEKLFQSLQLDSPVSLRYNLSKLTEEKLNDRVLWADTGVYLPERLTFTFDPLFHAGCYYVQEASSMFLEQAVKQYITGPALALDLCAAPGGKSTHLRSLLPEDSLLVANEVIRSRSHILAENVIKWGHPDVIVTNNDPADFRDAGVLFDLVVADVPCSGEGMFRKDPEAINEWSLQNVELCCHRQRRIIADIWSSIKPGGILIYSTCTFNTKEDEENVQWISRELGAEVLGVDHPQEWNITGNLLNNDFPVYRFLPHKTRGEGFFMAVLRKTDDEIPVSRQRKNKKTSSTPVDRNALEKAKQYIESPEKYSLEMSGSNIIAIPEIYKDQQSAIRQRLNIVHSGIPLGEVKGKDIIPSHALAMSNALKKDVFESVGLDYNQAISYLRKEAIMLENSAARGFILVTYKDVPLGFVKNLGNRANNNYPQEWRIRTSHLPAEIKTIT